MRTLRPHQQTAYEKVRAEWDSGVVRTAVVHATGLGKGDLISKMVTDEARAGGRALVLCHRAEVLDQLTDRCRLYDPTIPVGRVQASRNQSRRPVTMAMIQTLASQRRRDRLPKPSLVVIDECHRAGAQSYIETLTWAGSFEHVRTVGFTATLVRADRRGLGDVFETVADSRDIAWAVENELLVRPRGRVVVADHMDLEKAKVSRGDFVDVDLGDMVSQSADEIVRAWIDHAENRITIAFVPTVDSAHELRDAFLAKGVAAECVTGSTPAHIRQGMYARLASGETRVLVNVYVLVEGFDVSAVSCVLQARPTRLPGTYAQMVGRALRLHPGKTSALILDVVGASRHQKLTTLIDLSPTAEVDTSELDDLPCFECGLAPCECPKEVRERDPEGGRRKLIGPATYEDHDFFTTSSLNWLFTHGGIRFLPAGDRMAILWPEGDGFLPGHGPSRRRRGDAVWLSDIPLPLGEARLLAEAWALAYDPTTAAREAGWRKRGGKPSEAQVGYAAGLGIVEPEQYNRARLSDEISIVLASRVVG